MRLPSLFLVLFLVSVGGCFGPEPAPEHERIVVAGSGFRFAKSGKPWVPWGFNYDHDSQKRLLEDYWGSDWASVEGDFREMKELGATVVRVHLQFGRFMTAADKFNLEAFQKLDKLLELAEETGLYLDLTGLANYRRSKVPDWYRSASDRDRWAMQARFWDLVSARCAASPMVFCYTLMNEPISPSGASEELWGATLGGFQYVEKLMRDPGAKTRPEITREWIKLMSGPIRRRDPSRLISCGSFFLFDVATGLTLGPDPKELASSLDFLSVHLYPEDGKVETSIMLLKSLVAAGKPVLIQEMFPLHCSMPTFRSFLEQTHGLAAGWISFYWGTMPPELRRSGLISDALLASWLDFVLEEGPRYRAPARP